MSKCNQCGEDEEYGVTHPYAWCIVRLKIQKAELTTERDTAWAEAGNWKAERDTALDQVAGLKGVVQRYDDYARDQIERRQRAEAEAAALRSAADKIVSDLLFAVSEMSTDDARSAFSTPEYKAAQQFLRDIRP